MMDNKSSVILHAYVQPETEVVKIENERLLQGFESGGEGGEIGGRFDDEIEQ